MYTGKEGSVDKFCVSCFDGTAVMEWTKVIENNQKIFKYEILSVVSFPTHLPKDNNCKPRDCLLLILFLFSSL